MTTKNVDIEYSLDEDGNWVVHTDGFDVSEKERAWGAVLRPL